MHDIWAAPTATGPVDVRVTLPGSKSMTNRALVLAALADGSSVITGGLRSRDTDLMAAALELMGVRIVQGDDVWHITPGVLRGAGAIDCGLAGTVVRFLPAVAGLAVGGSVFDGDEHLRERPVAAILDALRAVGVRIEGDRVPFSVQGAGRVRGGAVTLDASASSQFVSGLLLAAARFDEGIDVIHDGKPIPSQPHLDMTVEMLRLHGVAVDTSEPSRWRVTPGTLQPYDHEIEPDLSNAAPFVALAAVTGGRVQVKDWPAETTQAGDALRGILESMGCEVALGEDALSVTGPPRLRAVDLDLHDVGELAPAVAALCALAEGTSYLRGIAHIRGHETDRLAALARELQGLGVDAQETDDGLRIVGGGATAGVFHTYRDHRMAHAGVIIGAAVPGIGVENVATTSKTFPGFADVWSGLL